MASTIDPLIPADGVPAVKQEFRDNWGAAKTEIEALQIAVDTKAPLSSPTLSNPIFTGTVTVPDGALAIPDVSGLQTALDGRLEPTDIAAGTITPAPGALNLGGGADGQVLTKQADGSLALEAPSAGAVTPYQFGAVGDGVADDTAAVQAFFDHTMLNFVQNARIEGTFKLSSGILVYGGESKDPATKRFVCNARFEINSAVITDVLTLENLNHVNFDGRIWIRGRGTSTSLGVGPSNGVRIHGCGRMTIDRLLISGMRGWAVYDHTQESSHFIQIRYLSATNCGATTDGTRSHKVTASAFSRTGTQGSSNQRTVVTVTPSEIPAELATGGFMVVNGVPHLVYSFDAGLGTIEVYPWIKTAHAVPGQFDLIFGGGIRCGSGGTNAKWLIGTVECIRVGIASWLRGVGSPMINVFGTQFAGIGVALGDTATNIFSGATINAGYFEASHIAYLVQVCQIDTGVEGSFISGINGLDSNKIFSPRHIHSGDQEREEQYLPVTMLRKGGIVFPWNARNVRVNTALGFSGYNLYNAPRPWPESARTEESAFTVFLNDDVEYRRIKGNYTATFTMYGRGATMQGTAGGYKGTLTFSAAVGYTINGTVNQTLVVSAKEMPVTYYCTLEDNNAGNATVWRVSAIAHTAP